MKRICCLIIFSVIIGTAFTQNMVKSSDIDTTIKLISSSLPAGWVVNTEGKSKNEFVIESSVIELNGSMTANDPLVTTQPCRIFILPVYRVSPDSIDALRKRNQDLKDKLPPQDSKTNLKKWYEENKKTLEILDSEPTHYDGKYSYRIKCAKFPIDEKSLGDYEKIMKYLNQLFTQY